MKKIGIIINPKARGVKRMSYDPLHRFKTIAREHADIRLTNSVSEVDAIAREYKKNKMDYIGVCGGDGTFHHVISRFISVYKKIPIPPILHMRAGTMNTLPRTIRLKGKPHELLERFVTALRENRGFTIHERDSIMIEDRYCFIFGIGMTANFLYEYYQGEGTGPKKAIKVIFRAIRGAFFGADVGTLLDRVSATVVVDGNEVPHYDFLAVIAATVDDVGIGFRPLYRAYEKSGTFHVISVGCTPKIIIKNLYNIKTGRPIVHPNVFDTIGKRLRITSKKKMLYTMDGDLYEADRKLVAEAGPRIRMVYV